MSGIPDDPLPRPPAQDAALFRREDIDAAARGEAISLETLDRLARLVESLPPPPPAALVMPSWVMREAERFASSPYYPDDKADALALAWQNAVPVRSDVPGGPRAERVRLQALERTGRVLVAWLIGRWRR